MKKLRGYFKSPGTFEVFTFGEQIAITQIQTSLLNLLQTTITDYDIDCDCFNLLIGKKSSVALDNLECRRCPYYQPEVLCSMYALTKEVNNLTTRMKKSRIKKELLIDNLED